MGSLPSAVVATRNALAEWRGKRAQGARSGARASHRSRIFFGLVLAPTALAVFYYGLLASDRYGSKADFVVRSAMTQRATGLERLFQSFGLSRTVDDGNAVQSYLLSRDAVRELDRRLPLRQMFARSSIDRLARFPKLWRTDSFESLYDYYLDRVSVIQNPSKGIFELYVVTFDPAESQRIARELLNLAEEMVNRLNARAHGDAIAFAQRELAAAGERVAETQRKLTAYRNEMQFVDPSLASAAMLETITTLSTQLAASMAELENLKNVSPANPAVKAARERVDTLRQTIQQERFKLAGNNNALASKLSTYEQLALELKLAESSLASANVALNQSRQDARRQAIFLEEVVSPNTPDESNEPKRLRMIATVFVVSFAGASVVWLLLAGAKEHVIS